MAAIAREQVVAAGPRQQHLRAVFAGALGDQKHVDRGRIGLRFVKVPEHGLELVDDFRTHDDLAQVGVEVPRHLAGVGQIRGAAFEIVTVSKPDRVADRPLGGARVPHRRDDAARIESARQEGADRHVANQLPLDRLPEQLPQVAREGVRRAVEPDSVVRQDVVPPLA